MDWLAATQRRNTGWQLTASCPARVALEASDKSITHALASSLEVTAVSRAWAGGDMWSTGACTWLHEADGPLAGKQLIARCAAQVAMAASDKSSTPAMASCLEGNSASRARAGGDVLSVNWLAAAWGPVLAGTSTTPAVLRRWPWQPPTRASRTRWQAAWRAQLPAGRGQGATC